MSIRFLIVVLIALATSGCARLAPLHVLDTGVDQARVRVDDRVHLLDAAFSPDGRAVAAGCSDGVVRVWDVASGRRVAERSGFPTSVTTSFATRTIAFSPDGWFVAFARRDGAVVVWEWRAEGDVRALIGHAAPPHDVVWTRDGRVVTASGGFRHDRAANQAYRDPLVVIAWDAASGRKLLRRADDEFGAQHAVLAGDGRHVAVAAMRGLPRRFADLPKNATLQPQALVWDLETDRRTVAFTSATVVWYLAISDDGRRVFSSGPGGGTRSAGGVVRDLATRQARAVPVMQATFSADGSALVAVQNITETYAMSPLYLIGLPIPPPPKPAVRATVVDVASGQARVRRERRTRVNSRPVAWTGDGKVYLDSEWRVWRVD